MSNKIVIFDSTLRDGAQAEGISYSVEDKWKIVQALDELGGLSKLWMSWVLIILKQAIQVQIQKI